MEVYFYDLEVYPNCILGVFISERTPQAYIDAYVQADIHDDKIGMAEALEKINPKVFLTMFDEERVVGQIDDMLIFVDQPDVLLIGFNNNEYDDLLVDFATIKRKRELRPTNLVKFLQEFYNMSSTIIEAGYIVARYDPIFKGFRHRYNSIDTLKSLYETTERKSLKQTMINLKWYNVLDLPIPPGTHITWSMVDRLLYYCTNDVLGTRAFYVYNARAIQMKKHASILYGTFLLNKNKSAIADALLQKMYLERTGLRYYQIKDLRTFRTTIKLADIIDPRISFEYEGFNNYLTKLKNFTLNTGNPKALNVSIPFKGNLYSIKKGGLHSKDLPGIYRSTSKLLYKDGDVISYYPNLVVEGGYCPAHLFQPIFTDIGRSLKEDRESAKERKNTLTLLKDIEEATTIADVLKIVINSGIFGKFGYEKGWLYDLLPLYATTINGELKLMKWAEMLEFNNFQVLSVNTDGITAVVSADREKEYEDLSRYWGSLFGLNVEFNEYTLYARQNVNSYFAVYKNGKIKKKGRFLTELTTEKGYDKPILAMALINYIKDGISVNDTLHNHKNIYDFCMSQKLGEAYQPEFHELVNSTAQITPLQKNIRYYVSKDGGRIMKTKGSKKLSVLREQAVLFNKFIDLPNFEDYNIDYSYYHRETMKILNDLTHQSTRIMRKTSGNLFDELEDF